MTRTVKKILAAGCVSALATLAACSEPVRPGVGDHWHVAYGFYICDQYVGNLRGNLEEVGEDGKPVSKDFRIVGVHSHEDGLIHFHPYSGLAAGEKANLGLFLSMYGIGMNDSQIDLPKYLGGMVLENLTVCKDAAGNDVDGELRVQYWSDTKQPDNFVEHTENLGKVVLTEDMAAVAVVFAPAGKTAPLPPSVGASITDM